MISFVFAFLVMRHEVHGFVPALCRGRKAPITQCFLENSDTNTPKYQVNSYLESLNQIGVAPVHKLSYPSSDPSYTATRAPAGDDESHGSDESRIQVTFSANYLDAISSSTRSVSGTGPRGYLDEFSRDAPYCRGHSLLGLTEAGDFAIPGINCEEPVSPSEDALKQQSIRGSRLPYSGMGSFLEGLISNDLLRSSSATVDSTITSTTQSIGSQTPRPSEGDSQEQKRMQSWLVGIIPTLNETDLAKYAKGLVGIGFDSECVTVCELRLSDLQFMKVLHRRYFFNEISGLGHPLKQ
jgi:hypothetical protein